ncbi:uncharacterized protein JCM6883_000766 [Sporobolomyces salmoneus]|uniref:uncharacterized protein n=1 Tax=Sporobolomyces salmoneus TaxID=183962 RepID=UPI00316D4B65
MANNQEGFEDDGGEQGDYGLDLFTEQDLVDRLVQAVTDDDLYQVVFWVKRLEEKGWIENINDGHSASTMTPIVAAASKEGKNRNRDLILRVLRAKGGELPSGDDAIWLELIGGWAIELLESENDPKNADEIAAKYLLSATDEEAEQWIAENISLEDVAPSSSHRSHSVPAAGPSSGRSNSLPSRYTPLGSASSSGAKYDHYASSPQYKPIPPRNNSLAPIAEPSIGYIDLTTSRSPSPVLKAEPVDDDHSALRNRRTPPASSRKPSTKPTESKGKGRATDDESSLESSQSARAHLRIDNLPIHYTDDDLTALFSDLQGVVEASIQDQTQDSAWGLITFKSLLAARHAYAVKIGKVAPGGVRGLQLKIYSSEGEPIEPHVAVAPVATRNEREASLASRAGGGGETPLNGNANGGGGGAVAGTSGGERYTTGFSGGTRPEGQRGQIYSGQDAAATNGNNYNNHNNNNGGGGPVGNYSHPGPMPFQGRFFPRPRVPYIFTAAELARRVYLGGLPFGITDDEVGRIFSEKAKVKARVLRVKNSPDGSHAFAFVQHPDSITADFAIKSLHGQVYAGHLLQLEHVNELSHRWLFSLTLYGFPSNWEYRDVSDFLISTIGSFAGLRVSRPWGHNGDLSVRVELRYETELRWAANELNGLIVRNEPIRAEVDQVGIRKKIEREMAYEKLQEKLLNPDSQQQQVVGLPMNGGGGGASSAYSPYNPNYASTLNTNATSTPAGALARGETPSGRSRPAPPPPPPPAKRSRTEGSLQPPTPLAHAISEEIELNPFSPRWMIGGK